MGSHGVASARLRAGKTYQHAGESAITNLRSRRALTLRDWPVSWRLIAVIVLALIMGLVFGGLRIGSAADSAAQFGRVSQLANLGEQVTVLTQDLQNERDKTLGVIAGGNLSALQSLYGATGAEAAKVQALAAGVDGSFPANIQASVAAVLSQISAKGLSTLRTTAQGQGSDVLGVIADYATPISDMITLNDEIAQGTSDSILANDVRTLNSLSLAKDTAGQQRALLYNAFTQQFFGDGVVQALTAVQSEEFADEAAFEATATPAQRSAFASTVNGPGVNKAEVIEDFFFVDGGDQQPLNTANINPASIGFTLAQAPTVWYRAMSQKLDEMQAVEQAIAGNIVARAQSLQQGAQQSALVTSVLTAIVLLLVLIAALLVARSLVMPLRRLREGALDIATVQLPERVRQLGEAQDPTTSLEVAPIDVLSADEIGQVARAFDQVHSEAVRLAGNEAMLRNSFNAMFVNLSRRSQSLIERLARMIDSLEQNEADPDRLSNLFSMDHLVTRMRRNSENLLLLAGHESARKWSEPVPLADVARAATSEIEQYSRVTLKVQPGVSVTGPAVSDVVHLLAEVIENATIFSAKDTQVQVSAQEVVSGGVLIEVRDNGVGIPEARLSEMNLRLDNPPVIDVSVSRHMGLFAVARLAERHGVRVRLRTGSPRGLTALVWLPDSVIEREAQPAAWAAGRLGRQPAATARHASGSLGFTPRQVTDYQPATPRPGTGYQPATSRPGTGYQPATSRPATDYQPANGRTDAVVTAQAAAATTAVATGPRETAQPAGPATSNWFRSTTSSATSAAADAPPSPAAAPQSDDGKPFSTDGWAVGKHAAQIVADPVRGDHTTAGLPVRVPRANLLPGSVGGSRAGIDVTSRAAGSHDARPPTAARSPETARSRLSGFQRGARRAKGQTPRAGEGASVELCVPPGPELARHRLHHASG
jgi:signal transduction histidine kinase